MSEYCLSNLVEMRGRTSFAYTTTRSPAQGDSMSTREGCTSFPWVRLISRNPSLPNAGMITLSSNSKSVVALSSWRSPSKERAISGPTMMLTSTMLVLILNPLKAEPKAKATALGTSRRTAALMEDTRSLVESLILADGRKVFSSWRLVSSTYLLVNETSMPSSGVELTSQVTDTSGPIGIFMEEPWARRGAATLGRGRCCSSSSGSSYSKSSQSFLFLGGTSGLVITR
mmetsp:Transcript_56782/g.124530  ORF Transcript_56782/g.124530 Transcript_56782/m.124530 type:complete len:229 (+) Transcript_56782:776-1462(+)